jgi:hypothetical protein
MAKTRKLWWWLQYRGLAETTKAVRDRVVDRISGADDRRAALEREHEREFDLRYGVDTGGRVPATQHQLDARDSKAAARQASEYAGIEAAPFRSVLNHIGTDLRGYVFIDYGSGKGKALLLAADYPFDKIIGVELMPELHASAVSNIAIFRSEQQRCFDLTSVLQDAGQFEPPPAPLVCFFYNPFGPQVMKQVIERLLASLQRAPRPVYVVYGYPVYVRMFLKSGFRLLFREPGYRVLYADGSAAPG